jgi:hypothetical protein
MLRDTSSVQEHKGDGRLRIDGGLVQGDHTLRFGEIQVDVGNELFLGVYPGRRVYFVKSATERKFQSPGIVLFRKGTQPFEQVVTLPTRKLAQAGRIEFAGLRGGAR